MYIFFDIHRNQIIFFPKKTFIHVQEFNVILNDFTRRDTNQ